MKILLLFLLIACGKEATTPAHVDLNDSDGDGIPNYLEEGHDKYIADVQSLPRVTGTIDVLSDSKSIGQFTFLNNNHRRDDFFRLLTANSGLPPKKLLSEWTKLSLNGSLISDKKARYSLKFVFHQMDISPQGLLFTQGSKTTRIADWSSRLEISVSREDLIAIENGEAYFSITSEWLEHFFSYQDTQSNAVKEKTYRIYFSDGKKNEIIYVSQEMDFQEALNYLKVSNYRKIEDTEMFNLHKEKNIRSWWVREIDAKNKIIVWATPQEFGGFYRNNFDIEKRSLKRSNGVGVSTTFKKDENAKFYIVIRGSKELRQFKKEETVLRYTPIISNEEISCSIFRTAVVKESAVDLTIEDVEKDLKISIDGMPLSFEQAVLVEKGSDAQGVYWQLRFDSPGKDIRIDVPSREPETFITIGITSSTCFGYRPSADNLNSEKFLDFKVESFIEKI